MTENPFATKALREELRREALAEIAMGAVGFCHDIPVALDGLDIAEEMALAQEVAEYCKNRFAPYTRHWRSLAEHRLWKLLRCWQDWQAKRADGGHGSIGGG